MEAQPSYPKNLPVHVDTIDSGRAEIIEETELKGRYVLKAEEGS